MVRSKPSSVSLLMSALGINQRIRNGGLREMKERG